MDNSVHITVSKFLRPHTAGTATAEVHASTVREALEAFFHQFPEMRSRILLANDDREVRRFVHVYLNGKEVRSPSELDRHINGGDELILNPDVA